MWRDDQPAFVRPQSRQVAEGCDGFDGATEIQQQNMLAFDGAFTFEDLETRTQIKVDAGLQQKQYTGQVNKWIHESRMWMLEKHINYELVVMDNSFEKSLRDFLRVRKTVIR